MLAGMGNRSCGRCHSAPSECLRELMALVLLHHTVKCCSNLSEAKVTAQALINPFSTAPFPRGQSACECVQGQVHDTGVCVWTVAVMRLVFCRCSYSLVSSCSLVFSMNKIPLILNYFMKSLISDWLSRSVWSKTIIHHQIIKPSCSSFSNKICTLYELPSRRVGLTGQLLSYWLQDENQMVTF